MKWNKPKQQLMSINQSINQYIYNVLVKLLPISINNKIIRSAGKYSI